MDNKEKSSKITVHKLYLGIRSHQQEDDLQTETRSNQLSKKIRIGNPPMNDKYS